jgi:fermentation-respiration switch protein FrsA (DUF1100 family)
MRAVLIGLAIAALLYAALLAAAWHFQERLVWQPPGARADTVLGAQRLGYTAADGQPLVAWLVGDPTRARGLLIAFHGNAEVAAWSVPWALEVERRTGWAVLLPEYRGYGGLTGVPSQAGSRLDAQATYALAQAQLGADTSRIAYYGHSLGTAVASELALVHRPSALLLLAPFTSAQEMARAMSYPIGALWPVIGRVAFDTRANVARLDAPVAVAHGDRDRVVPVAMGKRVHAAARVKGELLIVPGAGHNDVMVVAPEEYWGWIAAGLGVPTATH